MSTPIYPAAQALNPVDGPVSATVTIPGSKSITNRALILAALADGVSELIDPLASDDTRVMIDALTRFGVKIIEEPERLIVAGRARRFLDPGPEPIFVGNSGTSVRFLTAASAFLPAGATALLNGVPRMQERPIGDLIAALRALGVDATDTLGTGCPPVSIAGGGLPGGCCELNGEISSQFLTAILLAAPLAKSDVVIEILGNLISKPYIDLTRSVVNAFGADFSHDDYRRFRVKSGQSYSGRRYEIEADASSATYFMAAAAVTGGTVTIENLNEGSSQGDVEFARVLELMGCTVTYGLGIAIAGPERLRAIDVDMEAMPDAAMTLASVAAFADGPSRVTGLSSLRVKETDRLAAVAAELEKIGTRVEADASSWTIHPVPVSEMHGAVLETYDDHRMAMALSLLGLRVPGIVIDNPGCVAKTFPDFWVRWQKAFHALPE